MKNPQELAVSYQLSAVRLRMEEPSPLAPLPKVEGDMKEKKPMDWNPWAAGLMK